MIGFFDSGLGGLTVLKEVLKEMPEYSYLYLGDNARTPYGSRSRETVYQFTVEGVAELFKQGAEIVILACNTSSAAALRRIQQDWLPANYPDKRVLGILIPTAEEVGSMTKTGEIGILATEATVNSGAYINEIEKYSPGIKVYQQACPLLVPIIEAGETEWPGLDLAVEKYLNELFKKSLKIDTIILGCTHYAVIMGAIRKCVPKDISLVSQGPIISQKLKRYLSSHSEIEEKIKKQSTRVFLTTEDSEKVKNLAQLFWGSPIEIKAVVV